MDKEGCCPDPLPRARPRLNTQTDELFSAMFSHEIDGQVSCGLRQLLTISLTRIAFKFYLGPTGRG